MPLNLTKLRSNEVTIGHIFENLTLTNKLIANIKELAGLYRAKNQPLKAADINEMFHRHDMELYGMSFDEASKIINNDQLQKGFESKYGISFEEYLTRLHQGEKMGNSMVNGGWTSTLDQ